MSYTSTTDGLLGGNWSVGDMVTLVRSMIDKVECHVLLKESLPEGLVQGLYETINNIEAEILSRRAALSLVQNQIEGCDTETVSSQSEWAQHVLPVNTTQKDNNLGSSLAANQGCTESRYLERQDANEDSRPVVADKQGALDSLHDNIKAIQAVVLLRMSDSMASKTSRTSSMVSFSILEEEMEILDGLSKHVTGSYKPPDDQSGDLLEIKLMALPTLLNALFNMEIREAVEQGSDIDDNAMMTMVMENQKRTNVLRDIDGIANRVKEVTRNIQENARA
ncbi:hypothetical protein F5883DRAFT_651143 [Diaporthe sp. PMI_573]|nr:hypothetical protein F5883DRAFT_651143 [Diaporthaceae sp. PMI_573]